MAGLRISRVIRALPQDIVHDANDVCESGNIPSWFGEVEDELIYLYSDLVNEMHGSKREDNYLRVDTYFEADDY